MVAVAKKISENSTQILDRFFQHRSHDSRLALTQPYFDLLDKLGNPHQKLPPVFHVAGTNGKGSTCAFLRAMLEAAGYKVHVYTSPHLVRFHERIRIAGELIGEEELVDILLRCEAIDERKQVSDFEAATAAAFYVFAKRPADFTILETGLGGRLDATNVVENKLGTLITRISYDHRDYLGDTLAQIAREKAGIMRKGVPCFAAPQPDDESSDTLRKTAEKIGAPFSIGTVDWTGLPPPGLAGKHQYENAGLAIAALQVLPKPLPREAIMRGLQNVDWPARLQRLEQGILADLMPKNWELWLDGGHNDSAGEVLAAQADAWSKQDGRPLALVVGMLRTKQPKEFLQPFAPYVEQLCAVAVPGEEMSFSAEDLAREAHAAGIKSVAPENSIAAAIEKITKEFSRPARILICGSLYLAGDVLKEN